MSPLLVAYRVTGAALLAALSAVIVVQLATGRINTHGLLNDKNVDSTNALSPARVQLLASTLAVAALYVYRVVTSGSLPDISGSTLAFVGASHVTYVVGKALTLLSGRSRFFR